jgi:protein TonB
VSVLVHALVLAALVALQLTNVIALPAPTQVLAYVQASPIAQVPDPPAPPRSRTQPASADSRPHVSSTAAPVVEPRDIAPETVENVARTDRPGPPVDGGLFGVPDGLGHTEAVAPSPSPNPAPPAPMRLHSGIRAPTKLVHVAPAYPAIARAAHVQGVVIIEATLDADGSVAATRVLRSIPLLDRAAVDAVRQWRFTPTLLNGVPVAIIMTVTVNFALEP